MNLFSTKVGDVTGAGRNLGIPGFYQIGEFQRALSRGALDAYRRHGRPVLAGDGRLQGLCVPDADRPQRLELDAAEGCQRRTSIRRQASPWCLPMRSAGRARCSTTASSASPCRRWASTRRLTSSPRPTCLADFQDFASGTTTFTNLGFPFRTVRGFVVDDNFGNPNIKPERTIETELGLETRLFNGHARADISVYNRSSSDQIFRVPVATSTGIQQRSPRTPATCATVASRSRSAQRR